VPEPPTITSFDGSDNVFGVVKPTATASNGPIEEWEWSASGASPSSSSSATPTFTYTSNGSKSIEVRARNSVGWSDWRTFSVTVNLAVAPEVTVSNDGVSPAGVISASASATNGPITSWVWSIDSGSVASGQGSAAATFSTPGPGTYVVTVNATNGAGLTDTDSFQVTIAAPPPPVAGLSITNTGALGVSVGFTGTADPGATFAWDFGDGVTATGPNATHTFASAGDYTISLTVTNPDNQSDSSSQTVTVP